MPRSITATSVRNELVGSRGRRLGRVAAAGIVVMVMPRFTRAVPAPLVAMLAVTVFVVVAWVTAPTVGDEGGCPAG